MTNPNWACRSYVEDDIADRRSETSARIERALLPESMQPSPSGFSSEPALLISSDSSEMREVKPDGSLGLVGTPRASRYAQNSGIESCDEFAYESTWDLSRWYELHVDRSVREDEAWLQFKAMIVRGPVGSQYLEMSDRLQRPIRALDHRDWGRAFTDVSILDWYAPSTQSVKFGLPQYEARGAEVLADINWHIAQETALLAAGYSYRELEDIRQQLKRFEEILGEAGVVRVSHFYAAYHYQRRWANQIDPRLLDPRLEMISLLNGVGSPREALIYLRASRALAARFSRYGQLKSMSGRWRPSSRELRPLADAPEGYYSPADPISMKEFDDEPHLAADWDSELADEFDLEVMESPDDPALAYIRREDVRADLDLFIRSQLNAYVPSATLPGAVMASQMSRETFLMAELSELHARLTPLCNRVPNPCLWAPSMALERILKAYERRFAEKKARCLALTAEGMSNANFFSQNFESPPLPPTWLGQSKDNPLELFTLPQGLSSWPTSEPHDWGTTLGKNQNFFSDIQGMDLLAEKRSLYDQLMDRYLEYKANRREIAERALRKRLDIDPATGLPRFGRSLYSDQGKGNAVIGSAANNIRTPTPDFAQQGPGCASLRVASASESGARSTFGGGSMSGRLVGVDTDGLANPYESDFSGVYLGYRVATGGVREVASGNFVDITSPRSFSPQVGLSLSWPSASVDISLSGTHTQVSRIRKAYSELLSSPAEADDAVPVTTQLLNPNWSFAMSLRGAVSGSQTFALGPIPVVLRIGLGLGYTYERSKNFVYSPGLSASCDEELAWEEDSDFHSGSLNVFAEAAVGVAGLAEIGVKGRLLLLSAGVDSSYHQYSQDTTACHLGVLKDILPLLQDDGVCEPIECEVGNCPFGANAWTIGVDSSGKPALAFEKGDELVTCRTDSEVGADNGDAEACEPEAANTVVSTCPQCLQPEWTSGLKFLGELSTENTITEVGSGAVSAFARLLFVLNYEVDLVRWRGKLDVNNDSGRLTPRGHSAIAGYQICEPTLFGCLFDECRDEPEMQMVECGGFGL